MSNHQDMKSPDKMALPHFAANLAAAAVDRGGSIRIIFLDVDGVLNSTTPSFTGPTLDPICLERLAGLIEQTGAKIVLSTSWRLLPKLMTELGDLLADGGVSLSHIVGQTAERRGGPRSAEIIEWVVEHTAQVSSWVALDDLWMDPEVTPAIAGHAIQTVGQLGLQDHDVEAAIEVLTGGGAPFA